MRIPNPKLSRRGYVALTVAGILVPTLFLGLLGLHLVRQHYRFQGEILAEYGRFSVDYVASEIQSVVTSQERDIANYLQLLALASGFRAEDELRRVEETYPLVESAFAYGEDGWLRFGRRDRPIAGAPAVSIANAQAQDSTQARAERILRRTLDDITLHHVMLSNEVHFYAGVENGKAYQYAAFPYRNSKTSEAGVMGYFLDVGYLRQQFLGRVLEKAIHEAEGRFAPDFGKTLTLVVRDEKGQSVHTHRHAGCEPKMAKIPCPKRDLAHAGLDDLLPGWRVGITYTDPRGFGWMRRIFTLQVALLVFASGLVVAGTLVAMRFALRQMELSRLKSHFVSNITHEIKTPLAAIRLYTETLQQGRVRDRNEAERFLGIIHKESARLSALIDNILDLGRIEAGGRRYAFDPADLGAVVREVVDRYAFQLRDKGFDLQLEIEDGLPETLADRDAVGQAVLNLLDNAVKYSRDTREVRITVNAEASNGQGNGNGNGHGSRWRGHGAAHGSGGGDKHANGHGSILIRVRDRGIGIPASEQTKIFDTFYRVEKGLEHDVKGSGLGLALVKQVAEAHGGTIEVESRPGAGSTFTLQIPVRGSSVPRASEPMESSHASPAREGGTTESEHAPTKRTA